MTISEVIAELQTIQATHGNLPVVVEDQKYLRKDEVFAQSVALSVERFYNGRIIFKESPDYSEDLPKVVWV